MGTRFHSSPGQGLVGPCSPLPCLSFYSCFFKVPPYPALPLGILDAEGASERALVTCTAGQGGL